MKIEVALIGDGILSMDKELFFGPVEREDKFYRYQEDLRMPQLLKDLGFFQSSSEARRNGWNKEIPNGYFDWGKIGKYKRELCTLKIFKKTTGIGNKKTYDPRNKDSYQVG